MAILHAYKWSVGWFFFLAHSLACSSRLRLRHILTSSREGGGSHTTESPTANGSFQSFRPTDHGPSGLLRPDPGVWTERRLCVLLCFYGQFLPRQCPEGFWSWPCVVAMGETGQGEG